MKRANLLNQSFGKLTVIASAGTQRRSRTSTVSLWLCRCECGNERVTYTARLTGGRTTHCGKFGCRKPWERFHGHSKTQTYSSWYNMIARCTQPSHPAYEHYKRRNISFCERWRVFDNFLEDMGERPGGKNEYTLERIDNDKGYFPANCQWATWKEQGNNRTPNDNMRNPSAKLTDEQVSLIRNDPRTQSAIAAEYGVTQSQISRIKRGVQRKVG